MKILILTLALSVFVSISQADEVRRAKRTFDFGPPTPGQFPNLHGPESRDDFEHRYRVLAGTEFPLDCPVFVLKLSTASSAGKPAFDVLRLDRIDERYCGYGSGGHENLYQLTRADINEAEQGATESRKIGFRANVQDQLWTLMAQSNTGTKKFEVWRDEKTGLLWGDRIEATSEPTLSSVESFCASGSLETGTAGVSASWHVPTYAEAKTAIKNGLLEVLPNLRSSPYSRENQFLIARPEDDKRSRIWVFDGITGEIQMIPYDSPKALRCVGYPR